MNYLYSFKNTTVCLSQSDQRICSCLYIRDMIGCIFFSFKLFYNQYLWVNIYVWLNIFLSPKKHNTCVYTQTFLCPSQSTVCISLRVLCSRMSACAHVCPPCVQYTGHLACVPCVCFCVLCLCACVCVCNVRSRRASGWTACLCSSRTP